MPKVSPLDLWTPVAPVDQQHHNFRTIRAKSDAPALAVVSKWASSFVDRDGDFVAKFQKSFDTAFWELYLHAVFRSLGFTSDYRHARPDFVLDGPSGPLIAEAVIASNADGFCPEWDKNDAIANYANFDIHQAIRYTTTRLSGVFRAKFDKYVKEYSKLAHVSGKPYVICIAPFDHPFSFDWALQSMRRVLYGADQLIVHQHEESGTKSVMGVSEVHTITKESGEEFPIAYFRDPAYAAVSAVIFSSTATWGKVRALSDDPMPNSTFRAERFNAHGDQPLVTVAKKPHYLETLTDGLSVMLNPHASHRFDLRPFRDGKIAFENVDLWFDEHEWIPPHEWLIRRFVWTTSVGGKVQKQKRQKGTKYKEISRPKWKSAELRQVPAVIWPASENWMAHVDGWTVVVLRDGIDNTWHGFAVEQIAHTIPEVRELNLKEQVRSVWRLNDHESRDGAFADVRLAIAEAKLSNVKKPSAKAAGKKKLKKTRRR
jgi:hypothetical protein